MARPAEQRRVAQGLCARAACGREREAHGQLCEACRVQAADRAARRYEALRAGGKCPHCGTRDAAAGRLCVMCWFRNVASRRCGSAAHADMLRRKWVAQDGRCALTGIQMVPGDGASVDHIHPVSRGGAVADPDNLRWVLTEANAAKGTLDDATLFRMCRLILDGPIARAYALRDQGERAE